MRIDVYLKKWRTGIGRPSERTLVMMELVDFYFDGRLYDAAVLSAWPRDMWPPSDLDNIGMTVERNLVVP